MSDQGYEPTQVGQPAVPGPPPTAVGIGATPPGGGYGGPPGPYPPAPDRRPWIIGGLVAAIILVVVAILLVSGDDDDDDLASEDTTSTSSSTSSSSTSSSTSSTSSSTTSTTVANTTTTAAPTTTTTEPPLVTVPPAICSAAGDNPGNPDPAAQVVYDAWTRGDEDCARVLMTDAGFERLFEDLGSGAGATFTFQGCGEAENPEVEADCGFLTEGTSMHFFMVFSETEGWQVVDVVQNPD